MSFKLIAAIFAASALASPALAAGPGSSYDDVQYGDAAARFADGARHGTIDGVDVVYPAARLSLSTALRSPDEGALAQRDDVVYPTADATSESSRTAVDP